MHAIGAASPSAAWLALAVTSDRQHGGNDGYTDEPSSHYSWDDTVSNSRAVHVGDAIVIWDRRTLLGASIVDAITESAGSKLVHRCPACSRASIKSRKGKSPKFRCQECGAEFAVPLSKLIEITAFRTSHESGWVDLAGLLTGAQLRDLCVSAKSQLSLRPLKWDSFRLAVEPSAMGEAFTNLDATADRIFGGYKTSTVRLRVGQGLFRKALLDEYGSNCAITGPAPASVLEAAHLYSYANEGLHHESGGVLLRRDLHRLFDRGDLAIHPGTLTVDLLPDIQDYPAYAPLHGATLKIDVNPGRLKWFGLHWAQHRL